MLRKKIDEIKNILVYDQTDNLAQELFKLLELYQGKLLTITKANNMSKINIGGTEVSLSTAIIIRDNIKSKIDLLTNLIANQECTLDKIGLQQQRDAFYKEYTLLSMVILKNDLQVQVE